ncbi:Immunoglobulin subtype 2 domain and Immunoglobulin subtype domain and Immunoglobulin-like domain and Immunoglobulin I-set domain and Immunoglobulin V-set domain and Immunoglobulin-like fold domain-containing protein [Strongyloides ratti]|uniref:Ig-like domain-containing protein n=1 Tax=Strongyloides ratti TaxID=34506 RepID=A0A090LB96_STRRB|nr:Immunoglobulin subtype 2 domain and Immunoglobulin subtype domain and Immunoglobulin-like domain and Immunoglobulin I-set domain and Immunoglobulin V-set domain and Immunoglobulin-like fold domain-containing protein [Strongyloides ratti]CEF67032.1 Immunoglobulin subtype 2 domain and Immunoglobulin subtype domain and Immunoglobulin-like domain and Immunoglobulin I-set domain and Immunoglobulin V-set domain and Immunoglobulin-like fold domain-containing protein [Strongyloides ratti]
MLVSVGATTALMCDPLVIGNNGDKLTAFWYKNDEIVAKVTSNSNAILYNREVKTNHFIPEVGFLIISNISYDDEGFYYCKNTDNSNTGETIHLIIAYIDQLPDNKKELNMSPSRPYLGDSVRLDCPTTDAYPDPSVKWHRNGIDLDYTNSRFEVLTNGSLLINRIQSQDIGFYSCILSNFAGHTKGTVFVDIYNDGNIHNYKITSSLHQVSLISIFRSLDKIQLKYGLLWFTLICLTLSSIVLLYLLIDILISKKGFRNKFSQILLSFYCIRRDNGPGYGKIIVPAPDFVYRRNENASSPFNI